MKGKLTNNLGLKLLSLFFAFFVWLIVVNISNPTISDYVEVPVEVRNEEVLADDQLTYEIIGKSTVTVNYKVNTLNAYKIKASDFGAYIDLNNLYEPTGAVPVEIEIKNNKELLVSSVGVSLAEANPRSIRIKTEKVQRKGFDLAVVTAGTPGEGYALGNFTLSSDYVYVRGPVSQVGQISSIGIEIDVEGADSDIKGTATPTFYDANGNKLPMSDKVTLNIPEITYEMQILKVKNLTLDFAVSGDVAPGYRFTGIDCDTKSISVMGMKSVLASLTSITIPDTILSIQGLTDDKTIQVDVDQLLPPSATLVGENNTVAVTLKVEALTTRVLKLKLADIRQTGGNSEYNYKFNTTEVSITVRGLEEDLQGLTEADLNVSMDLEGLAPGDHLGQLAFQVTEGFEVVNYTDFELNVIDKNAETTTTESTVGISESETSESE